MAQATILIADDEPNLRKVLGMVLEAEGYEVTIAESGRDALKKCKDIHRLDLLVADYLMPDKNGLEVLEGVRKHHPNVRCVVISGHATVRSAVEAMRMGASDFLTKPFDVDQVKEAVARALKTEPTARPNTPPREGATTSITLSSEKQALAPADNIAGVDVLGSAPATQLMKKQLVRAAQASKATILLLGESGTGKEVAARVIHAASPRAKGPFIAVSCAALPETLLESELFGHEKSAFTGAMGAKPGRFELADGGTLFLDEIGDIPHLTQVKLLRALQEREISRIGGTKSVKVDVRVVAATNRDLWEAVQEGSFRADLYYRLHVVPINLPPLRERASDIASLAQYHLERAATENQRVFSEGISAGAMQLLTQHAWPGNIRELQNVLEYAVVMASEGATQIETGDLPDFLLKSVQEKQNLRVA
jgi:DNA-binding NtrC family response regulator